MDEPWMIFLDELKDRAEDIPDQELNREDDMAEAAHEAYEATADRLHRQLDWDEGEAIGLARSFMHVVKTWIDEGDMDWDVLEERLEILQEEWDPEMGASPA